MHPLDGPRLKIRRAKSEIKRLGRREEIFRENTKCSAVRKERNPKSGNYVMRVHIEGPLPSLEWGVYIGEIAHNLRSALDQLVYQLAVLNRGNISITNTRDWTRLQFPIFLSNNAFIKGQGKDMINLLCPKHKTSIKRLQPYVRKAGILFKTFDWAKSHGRNSPLFWLQQINNADKHRLIQVVTAKTGGFNITGWGDAVDRVRQSRSPFRILKEGAKICEVPPDVQVHIGLTPYIAFAHGCEVVYKRLVIIVLSMIADCVSEIVESFASEF